MQRRDFIRLMGMASGATLATSCGVEKGTHKLIPYLVPPDQDIIPGEAVFKNTTCTECPENCGLSAKIYDKLIDNQHKWLPTKLEGINAHPINDGTLCVRGQASLTRLYHENRIKTPQLRDSLGNFVTTSWDELYSKILSTLHETRNQNKKSVYLTNRTTGSISKLTKQFCSQLQIERLPEFEVFSHSAIRTANQILFNQNDIPDYRIADADFLLTIGADILETFVQPVAFARQLSQAKKYADFRWFHVEPHASLTGFQADKRLVVHPQSEVYLMAYLIHALNESARKKLSGRMLAAVAKPALDEVTEKTGLNREQIDTIVENIKTSEKPLVISGGGATASTTGLDLAILTGLLQWMTGMTDSVIDFSKPQNYSDVGSLTDMKKLSDRLANNDIGLIFISQTNPVKQLPPAFNFSQNLNNAALSIGLSDTFNETVAACDLIIPLSHSLESWGDAEPEKGLTTIVQPVLELLYDSVLEVDVLLELIVKETGSAEAANFQEYLFQGWREKFGASALDDFQKNGFMESDVPASRIRLNEGQVSAALAKQKLPELKKSPTLILTPSIRTFDGRSGDLQLLHEIPDPVTTISYGEWISISAEKAEELQIYDENHLKLSVGNFSFELPVKIQTGLASEVFVVQRDLLHDFPFDFDQQTGEYIQVVRDIKAGKSEQSTRIPILSGALVHKGEKIPVYAAKHDQHEKNRHDVKNIYKQHEHTTYRWAMAIDLEACTGCSACVAACYIENNIPMVGKKEHLMGREMSWIRIQPQYEQEHTSFNPMMCQHCDNAPCEPVCPVYAAYHNPEGLNAQIYNRCVGTRYCANNCPFKVRRFNWFDHVKPEPLKFIENPGVSVRSRGIMEKCSFCVQRIRAAKDQAKDEGRLVQDGEITPACAQTCPTNAIVFGNILDPESRVAIMTQSDRAFRELEELNTQPAVTYLYKKKKAFF